MKFTQRIRERKFDPKTGQSSEFGPTITFTVESDDFPICPDAVSSMLGNAVMSWLAPNRSISTKSLVEPWPMPDSWTPTVPYIGEGEKR